MKRYETGLMCGLRAVICACMLAGWWGMLYPELTITEATVRVVSEDGAPMEEGQEENRSEELLFRILRAPRGRVSCRSRLLDRMRGVDSGGQ